MWQCAAGSSADGGSEAAASLVIPRSPEERGSPEKIKVVKKHSGEESERTLESTPASEGAFCGPSENSINKLFGGVI